MTARGTTLKVEETLFVQVCYLCGITFAFPDSFDNQRRQDHKSWFCPNGHSQMYSGKTEAETLREAKRQLERDLANREESLRIARAEAIAERKSHAATKTQLTKTRKRAAAGVCPIEDCHRSISSQRMAQHMKAHERKGVTL